MKKIIVSVSLVVALAFSVTAAEKAEGKAACTKGKAACTEKAKAGCCSKGGCKEKSATKSSSNVKGAEVLKR